MEANMRRFAQTLLFFSIALVGFMQAPAQGEIKFRDSQKTYEAIGRVINAETGAGIAFYEIRCGKLNKTRLDDYPITDYQTDAQGRFRMTGLTSGTYQVSGLSSYGNNQFHAEMTTFVIADSNVEGVELKVYRLASVSGTVIFQGVVDEQSRERLISSGLAFEVKQTSKRGYPKRIPKMVERHTGIRRKISNHRIATRKAHLLCSGIKSGMEARTLSLADLES